MTSVAENISETKIRFLDFTEPFKEYRLGDITETISRPIKMEDEKDYLLVTVKRRNEGVVERGIYKGKEVKVKSQFIVDTGDFLISKRQIIHGACEIVPNNMAGAIVSNEYHILHGKKELLLTEYLNLLSKTPKLKNYFALACVGVDIEKMLFRIDDWKKRVVKIPSIEEQRKIVDFFNLFNRKLVKQQEKIEKLEQFKKGVMQKIFSQELRFKDEDGGEFPEWEKKKLGEVGLFKSGVGFSEKFQGKQGLEYPFIKVSDMNLKQNTKSIVVSNHTVSNEMLREMKAKAIEEPAILFAKVGAAIFLERKRIIRTPFLIDNNMMSFIPLKNMDLEFGYHLLNYLRLSAFAQVGALPSYNGSDLGTIKIQLPVLEEQLKMSEYINAIDLKIEKEKEKLMVLEEQKRGFMQGMFV